MEKLLLDRKIFFLFKRKLIFKSDSEHLLQILETKFSTWKCALFKTVALCTNQQKYKLVIADCSEKMSYIKLIFIFPRHCTDGYLKFIKKYIKINKVLIHIFTI